MPVRPVVLPAYSKQSYKYEICHLLDGRCPLLGSIFWTEYGIGIAQVTGRAVDRHRHLPCVCNLHFPLFH